MPEARVTPGSMIAAGMGWEQRGQGARSEVLGQMLESEASQQRVPPVCFCSVCSAYCEPGPARAPALALHPDHRAAVQAGGEGGGRGGDRAGQEEATRIRERSCQGPSETAQSSPVRSRARRPAFHAEAGAVRPQQHMGREGAESWRPGSPARAACAAVGGPEHPGERCGRAGRAGVSSSCPALSPGRLAPVARPSGLPSASDASTAADSVLLGAEASIR